MLSLEPTNTKSEHHMWELLLRKNEIIFRPNKGIVLNHLFNKKVRTQEDRQPFFFLFRNTERKRYTLILYKNPYLQMIPINSGKPKGTRNLADYDSNLGLEI